MLFLKLLLFVLVLYNLDVSFRLLFLKMFFNMKNWKVNKECVL